MIACDEIITVVLHTQGDDDDTYTCITISNASWFCKTTINTSGDGAKPVNSFDVRFFETPDGFVPQLGAYVVKGIVEKIDMPSDLDGKSTSELLLSGTTGAAVFHIGGLAGNECGN